MRKSVILAITVAARFVLVTLISVVCAGAWRADAAQINLVSDQPGLAALTDPNLINPWGITESPASPFWIADSGFNQATLYQVPGSGLPPPPVSAVNLRVSIPTLTFQPPQGPTGLVFNTTTLFSVTGTNPAGATVTAPSIFIFANLDGSISGWTPAVGGNGVATGTSAATVGATTPGASYTGLAISQTLLQPQLYAANHAGTGSIDVFNSNFQPVNTAGKFIDPNLPSGFVPFNVQDIGGKLYVTYAPANAATAGPGQGVVDTFDESGNFLARVATGGSLAAPWGLALAPASFGQFGGDLLVGNFSANNISAFKLDTTTGLFDFVGTIAIKGPGGLLGLQFGNGQNGGSADTLYFTDESDGLFGAIESPTATPLPAALPLFASGLGGLGLLGWRRKRKARDSRKIA